MLNTPSFFLTGWKNKIFIFNKFLLIHYFFVSIYLIIYLSENKNIIIRIIIIVLILKTIE